MRHLVFGAVLVVGCESIESSDVKTSGIWADLAVSADGTGSSRATAVLRAGGPDSNTFVDLVSDDALTVSVADVSQPMNRVALGDFVEYVADVAHDNPGDEWTIALDRALEEPAPGSTVSLPEGFEMDLGEGTLSKESSLTVTWTPAESDGIMTVKVDGNCIFVKSFEVEGDPGTFVIDGAEIEPNDGDDGASCDVDVTVTRARTGAVDPAYEGGTAQGRQVRVAETSWQAASY